MQDTHFRSWTLKSRHNKKSAQHGYWSTASVLAKWLFSLVWVESLLLSCLKRVSHVCPSGLNMVLTSSVMLWGSAWLCSWSLITFKQKFHNIKVSPLSEKKLWCFSGVRDGGWWTLASATSELLLALSSPTSLSEHWVRCFGQPVQACVPCWGVNNNAPDMLVAENSPCCLLNCPSFKAVVYSYENRCIDPMPATHTRSSAKRNLRFTSTTIHCSITLCNV